MFNDDAKFEYIASYGQLITDNTAVDVNADGRIDADDKVYTKTLGFKIMSEDGSTIQEVDISSDFKYPTSEIYELIKLNGKFYIVIAGWDKNDEPILVFYRINKSSATLVRRMNALPARVFPTVADRSQQITVELGENQNVREVIVVNAAGQTLKRIPVSTGQKQVVFDACGLSHGLNIVHTNGNEIINGYKIIVK